MASGLDALRAQLKKVGAIDLAIIGAALASHENKVKAIAKAVSTIAWYRLVPILGIIAGSLVGVRGAIKAIVKDSGALEAAWQRLAKLRLYQGQLEPFLKSAAAARARLAELIVLSNKSSSSLGQWVAGARAMEILSRGALGGTASLKRADSAARAAGVGIDSAANSIGGMYRELKDGAPIASAASELQRMGIITQQTVDEVTRLQESGASFSTVWSAVEASIDANTKATDDFGDSMEGLQKRLEDTQQVMLGAFGKPFLEAEKTSIANTIAVTENLVPVMRTLGETFSVIVTTGENLGGAITKLLTSIPGLSTAVGVMAKGFVAFGAAITVIGFSQLASRMTTVVPAVISIARSMTFASVAAGLLARQTVALAAAQAIEAGAATGSAAAQRALAASYGAGAVAATTMGTATSGLTVKLRALFIAVATNPIGLLVLIVSTLAAGFWQLYESNKAQTAALKELSDANAGVTDGLTKQIEAIRSADDAQQALVDSTRELIIAQEKLAQLKKEGAPLDQIIEAEKQTGRISSKIANAKASMDSGRLAPGREQEAVLRAQAARDLKLDATQKQNEIEKASGPRKIALLRQAQQEAASKAAEGRDLERDRARFNKFDARTQEEIKLTAPGSMDRYNKEEALRQAKRLNNSPIMRDEQAIADASSQGKDPGSIAKMTDALILRNQDIEGNQGQNEQRAIELADAVQAEERIQHLREIGLTAGRAEAALRSEGLKRAEEEAAIRILTIQAEQDAASLRKDSGAETAAQVALDVELQSLELLQRKAALQRASDSAHLNVLEAEQDALRLAQQGKFGAAAQRQKDAERISDAAANKASFDSKVTGGYNKTDAYAAVGREQRAREQGREDRRQSFKAESGRELDIREARLRGDGRGLQRLQDEKRARGYLQDGVSAGLRGPELQAYAARAGKADIAEDLQNKLGANQVVSSLAAIGGGGNTGVGLDVLKEEARRQTDLLRVIAENTGLVDGGPKLK